MVGRTGITYHQLQTFLAVARSGNLTKVARELNATQPTVSLQLRALRKSLGIPLFERPGGRFQLTPAGEKLRRYAEEALDGLRSLHQDIAVLKGSLTGSLAVGVTFFIVGRVMPRLLPRFRAQFPGVDLQVHIDRPDPLFNQLMTNTLDVVCYLKVRTPPGLTFEPLGQEELAIIASPRHRLAGRRRISAKELSEEPLVVSCVSVFRELIEARLRAVGVVPRVVAEAQNMMPSRSSWSATWGTRYTSNRWWIRSLRPADSWRSDSTDPQSSASSAWASGLGPGCPLSFRSSSGSCVPSSPVLTEPPSRRCRPVPL